MTYWQENEAPPECKEPRCTNLEEITCKGVKHDRCLKGIPMHPNCAWKVVVMELRERI